MDHLWDRLERATMGNLQRDEQERNCGRARSDHEKLCQRRLKDISAMKKGWGTPGDCRQHWRDAGAAGSRPFLDDVLRRVAVQRMAAPIGICAAKSHIAAGSEPHAWVAAH